MFQVNDINKFEALFLFEPGDQTPQEPRGYCFAGPVEILTLDEPAEVNNFFKDMERLNKEHYLAGYFSYELGYIFEEKLKKRLSSSGPLAVFCAFKKRYVHDSSTRQKNEYTINPGDTAYRIKNLKLDITRERYINNVLKIKDYIKAGDIYQANYTARYNFKFYGSHLGMYLDLKGKQKGLYNSYLKTSRGHILSFSPELFFEKIGNEITVKPMKGTAPRGIDGPDDDRIGRDLASDKKNLSENLMIVDLLRNDLSRVSERGSVKVEKLYELEKYPTLFQLTSTIKSKLKKSTGMRDIIMSLFPSRSVTGAPKIRAMEIINDFESTPRGVYCGAMGYFEPGGNAKFNVSIRTAAIESGKGIFGAGGGIIADSEPELEYKELKLKAKFLTEPGDDFRIIETMLYDGCYNLLEEHLYRMESSARYFDFTFDRDGAREKLKKLRRKLKGGRYKIRLLCAASGEISVSEYPVGNYPAEFKITLSDKHTHSANKFLYHKTTNRDLYNRELKKAQKAGFYDVVFFNQNGCLAEGARTNVFIKKNGRFLTPPAECGLLNGITRKDMIEKGEVKEKRLYKKDLISADAVYISNSIIGFKKALLLFK